jgi:predicted enzyme related to lactoylglutathione lyase
MEVFGWEQNNLPGIKYTRLLTKRISEKDLYPRPFEVNGAIISRDSQRTAPIVTISVDDMDATLRKIEEAGGKVLVSKTPFGSIGFTAYFRDTEGNVMGLWQARAHV